jgi:hypothetical protein
LPDHGSTREEEPQISPTVNPTPNPGPRITWRRHLPLIQLWSGLRLSTWTIIVVLSAYVPFTLREQAIPAWPPHAPLGDWLARLLFDPWLRWDAEYYLAIAARGYRSDDGTAQFHPLLGALAAPIAWISGQPMAGLLLVSSLAGLLCVIALQHLAAIDLPPEQAQRAALLLLCSPMGFVLFIPYTEGLFLLFSIICLYGTRRRRWWLAGLAGALAVLTRQQGIFLLIPLGWEIWNAQRDRIAGAADSRNGWADPAVWGATALIPGALLLWMIYRGLALGDLQPDFSAPQRLLYTAIISPSSSKVVPDQAFLPPWIVLGAAFTQLFRNPTIGQIIDLVLGIGFLIPAILAWSAIPWSYRLYVLATILVSFAYYTGPFYPTMGLPRHLLLAVPVFIGLAPRISGRMLVVIIGLGQLGMHVLLVLFGLEAWVP